ncbi:MAG: response regulator, partial [Prevotella sp.]|nr:response regulator [Prevotella sp.]
MAVRILSVDDEMDLELLLTQYFRRQIRKGEYEFSFAHNGLEALTMLLQNKDYDIILSDINMPEMDGLTLLAKINEMRNPALKCIMVSAYGDMGNIRQAMNNGAFDFATKPIDLDDLSVTIEKAVGQIRYIREMQAEHTELESIKGDLAVAREIQQAILPRIFPPFPEDGDQLDIAASMTAAKDVGGDFYDFFRIDGDRIG